MPRAVTPPYAYTLPPVYLAIPGTTIEVAQHNTPLQDLQDLANTAQPIQYGGTAATTVAGAQANLGIIPADRASFPLATGTGDVIVVTNTSPLLALTDGAAMSFTASAANTIAVTINVDGLGAKAGRKIIAGTDVALAANDLLTADKYGWVYSTAANAAAGAWIRTTSNTTQRNAPPGTAALPAFSFDADQNTGIYNPVANVVGVSADGVLHFSVTTSGATVAGQIDVGNGSLATPAYAFTNETASGQYRIGANNIGYAINAGKVLDISVTGLGVVGTTLSGDGTVSLPGFSFTSDPDTGVYRNGANILGLVAGGAAQVLISTTTVTFNQIITASSNVQAADGTVGAPSYRWTSDGDTGMYNIGANDIGFAANGVKQFEISTTAIIPRGQVDISGAAAGQIVFPATQNPSANANTLDDYEEGTWTPTFTANNSSTGVTYSTQIGRYTKIGRFVSLELSILLSNNGTGVGAARLTSLPFTSGATTAYGTITANFWSGGSAVVGNVVGAVNPGTAEIQLIMSGAVSAPAMTDTNCTNTFAAQMAGVYSTD